MSDTGIYILIALGVGSVIYFVLGKMNFGDGSGETFIDKKFSETIEETEKFQDEAMRLSRECLKEQQETNRLLKEIKEVMEKK